MVPTVTDYRAPDNRHPAFTDDDLEDLWRDAKVPVDHREAFSVAIERATAEYAVDKEETSAEARDNMKSQIERLAQNIRDWLVAHARDPGADETPQHMRRVKRSLENLAPATVTYLTRFELPTEHDAPFWIVEGLTRDVLLKLYGTCCSGADLPKEGRSRPHGKRSPRVPIIKYALPKTSVGQPQKIALDLLVARLAYAYEQATKMPATRFSPFSEFLVHLLSKIGEGSYNSKDPACLRRYLNSQKGD